MDNSTAIRGNIAEEANKLKQQPGQDILLFGSGKLVQTLMDLDLVDRYNLLYYPVVLGKGQPLFEAGRNAKLKLIESEPTSTGVVWMVYEPERNG